jgi:hypothetical protein
MRIVLVNHGVAIARDVRLSFIRRSWTGVESQVVASLEGMGLAETNSRHPFRANREIPLSEVSPKMAKVE